MKQMKILSIISLFINLSYGAWQKISYMAKVD